MLYPLTDLVFLQYVDGVITDDSDALLYGATVVYRQLSIKKVCIKISHTLIILVSMRQNVQFEKYTISNISSILGKWTDSE